MDDSHPKLLGEIVRSHWAVENNLHWVFDITFDEDSNRTRKGYSAANLAVIRHIALNLIKSDKTSKVGIKTERAKAGWDNQYLLKILGAFKPACPNHHANVPAFQRRYSVMRITISGQRHK